MDCLFPIHRNPEEEKVEILYAQAVNRIPTAPFLCRYYPGNNYYGRAPMSNHTNSEFYFRVFDVSAFYDKIFLQ
jgi:hypothetical protein